MVGLVPQRRRAVVLLAAWVAVAATPLLLAWVGIEARWFRPPYPAAGRAMAWLYGRPEAAYNFAEVVPGRLYRSASPDRALLQHARSVYGIQRIVALAGPDPSHADARALGMRVHVVHWTTAELPSREQLARAVELMAEGVPTLVHCASGSDRTGVAIAAYRVFQQGWAHSAAVEEMRRFWHQPSRHPQLHQQLARWLAPSRTVSMPD